MFFIRAFGGGLLGDVYAFCTLSIFDGGKSKVRSSSPSPSGNSRREADFTFLRLVHPKASKEIGKLVGGIGVVRCLSFLVLQRIRINGQRASDKGGVITGCLISVYARQTAINQANLGAVGVAW